MIPDLCAECRRKVREAAKDKKARRKAKAGIWGPQKDATVLGHRAETAMLRAFVIIRSEGRCEACGSPTDALELHHVEGGGLRRSRQRPGNVLMICQGCHRAAHRSDLDTLKLILHASPLDREARAAAERRVAKVIEARRRP